MVLDAATTLEKISIRDSTEWCLFFSIWAITQKVAYFCIHVIFFVKILSDCTFFFSTSFLALKSGRIQNLSFWLQPHRGDKCQKVVQSLGSPGASWREKKPRDQNFFSIFSKNFFSKFDFSQSVVVVERCSLRHCVQKNIAHNLWGGWFFSWTLFWCKVDFNSQTKKSFRAKNVISLLEYKEFDGLNKSFPFILNGDFRRAINVTAINAMAINVIFLNAEIHVFCHVFREIGEFLVIHHALFEIGQSSVFQIEPPY